MRTRASLISPYFTTSQRVYHLSNSPDFDANLSNIAAFVLFDSRLEQLKLPILKAPQFPGSTQHKRSPAELLNAVQKYFEWMGIFDDGEAKP